MKILEVINETRPFVAPMSVAYCDSFLCKLRGLTFRSALSESEGLLMDNGRPSRVDTAIHMMGVFFDLGILWLDNDLRVVDIKFARRWWSILAPAKAARYILEVHPNRLKEFNVGDQVVLNDA